MSDLSLLQVECRGTPRELGRAQGEAVAERVRAFVDQRLAAFGAYAAERGHPDLVEQFLRAGRECLLCHERWDPRGHAEHSGIAEAVGIEPHVLYAVSNMTDVRDVVLLPAPAAEAEGCTAVLVPGNLTEAGSVLVGQTWDLNPTDLEFVVAVHRIPEGAPESWAITCVGSLSLMGMNAEGVAVGTTNIKTRRSRTGVGYTGILHRALAVRTLEEAYGAVRGAPRAAAHTYWVAGAEGAREFEADPERVVVRELEAEPLVRTNHCLSEDFRQHEGEPPLSSSARRIERARMLSGEPGQRLESLRALFADRADGVDSINRYAEDAQGTTTNACLVASPAERRLWACRGPADRGEWVELKFS